MMLSEGEIRGRIRELDQMGSKFANLSHKILLVRNNQALSFGDADMVKKIVASLVELKESVTQHRKIAEAMASAQPYGRDKSNPTVNGLLSTLRDKSKRLVAQFDGLANKISELIRTAGSGNSSPNAKLTVAIARQLDNKFDHKTQKTNLGGPDDFLITLLLLITALKELAWPSQK